MTKIPFSVYDIFGVLIAGFIVLISYDYAFNQSSVTLSHLSALEWALWTVGAYLVGHLVAEFSSYLLERKLVRRILGPSESHLLNDNTGSRWAKVFRQFFEPLPSALRELVKARARVVLGQEADNRSIFLHCLSVVEKEQATRDTLSTFLYLYGFARNVATSLLFVIAVLVAAAVVLSPNIRPSSPDLFRWAGIAIVLSFGMLFRYLKFFRSYTLRVFIAYASAADS